HSFLFPSAAPFRIECRERNRAGGPRAEQMRLARAEAETRAAPKRQRRDHVTPLPGARVRTRVEGCCRMSEAKVVLGEDEHELTSNTPVAPPRAWGFVGAKPSEY